MGALQCLYLGGIAFGRVVSQPGGQDVAAVRDSGLILDLRAS